MTYKFVNRTRAYTDYDYYNSIKLEKETLDIDPITSKLLNHDNFDVIDGNLKIIHSIVRLAEMLPGVLIIEGNKSYGLHKNKRLYKCIPDDQRLPVFLIPYDIDVRSFSKKNINKYVVFKFMSWDNKHPVGQICQTIGDVTDLTNFYEYMLYCKSLNASMTKFNKVTSVALRKKSTEEYINDILTKYPNIEDRIRDNVYTIDPKNSKDFDDAFGIKQGVYKDTLSIYITNVPLWIDALGLWNSFSNRVATIYLPDRKRPMLPTILSDSICSLQEGELRFALALDLTIKDNTIISHKFTNTIIEVNKNYVYEEEDMKNNKEYVYLLKLVQEMNKIHKHNNKITNSHDVILYMMVLMNYMSSREMVKYNNGIYRSLKSGEGVELPGNLPDDVASFINMWKTSNGTYCRHEDISSHDILQLDSYMHITSPIRRLVDLLNIYRLQCNLGLATYSGEEFYIDWLNRLEFINISMRGIRKIQIDCDLLHVCSTNSNVLEKEYNGYLFDKIEREDSLYQYVAYLPELKMLSRLTMRYNIDNYTQGRFRLYIFNDESSFKRKVRVQMVID